MTQMKTIGLFHTPEGWDELMAWIHAHNVEERAHLTTAAAMAWNLAVKQMESKDASSTSYD